MRIAATQYNVNDKALEVFISGCLGSCSGCHNEPLKSFDVGTSFSELLLDGLITKIKENDLVQRIYIMGGEPLDNDWRELIILLDEINKTGKDIWLFTRYDYYNIPNKIISLCSYIKCGEYDENLKVDDYYSHGIKLATSNQKIYKRGELYESN